MSDKSYVSMERHVCIVCAHEYETGSILIDKRLRESLERYTTTGWGLCPAHLKLHNEGYVALVECDLEKSGPLGPGDVIEPQRAHRTGPIAHLLREAFIAIFKRPTDARLPVVFVEPGMIEKIHDLMPPKH